MLLRTKRPGVPSQTPVARSFTNADRASDSARECRQDRSTDALKTFVFPQSLISLSTRSRSYLSSPAYVSHKMWKISSPKHGGVENGTIWSDSTVGENFRVHMFSEVALSDPDICHRETPRVTRTSQGKIVHPYRKVHSLADPILPIGLRSHQTPHES